MPGIRDLQLFWARKHSTHHLKSPSSTTLQYLNSYKAHCQARTFSSSAKPQHFIFFERAARVCSPSLPPIATSVQPYVDMFSKKLIALLVLIGSIVLPVSILCRNAVRELRQEAKEALRGFEQIRNNAIFNSFDVVNLAVNTSVAIGSMAERAESVYDKFSATDYLDFYKVLKNGQTSALREDVSSIVHLCRRLNVESILSSCVCSHNSTATCAEWATSTNLDYPSARLALFQEADRDNNCANALWFLKFRLGTLMELQNQLSNSPLRRTTQNQTALNFPPSFSQQRKENILDILEEYHKLADDFVHAISALVPASQSQFAERVLALADASARKHNSSRSLSQVSVSAHFLPGGLKTLGKICADELQQQSSEKAGTHAN